MGGVNPSPQLRVTCGTVTLKKASQGCLALSRRGGGIYAPLHVIIGNFSEKIDFFDRFFLMESWHRISHSETLKAWSALCFALCFRTYVRWILKKHWFFGKPPTLRPPKPRKIWKSRKTKKCCGDDFRWTSFLPKTFFWYLFKKSFNLRKFRFQKNVIVTDV